ncbi:MAG: thiamine pyrophosphate-dependent enzyme [Candidatus Brocadiia bacterium]
MAVNIKELSKKPELLAGGHRACAGCGATMALRQIMRAVEGPVVVGFATGCMEVVTTIYPYTAWRVPYIHVAFENVAAALSGVEAAYVSLKKQGKIAEDINFIAFAGDGGTYDIGLQSLSGMLERGHNILYVCYDNEAYMNTGIQRSGSSPLGAATSTTPVGKALKGKQQWKKPIIDIAAAHGVPYVATASPHNYNDLMGKVQKAMSMKGPKFMNVAASCNRGWRFIPDDAIELVRMAVECCIFPLYEVENGVFRVTYKPSKRMPVADYLKAQGRFSHFFKPGGEKYLEIYDKAVEARWQWLLEMEESTKKVPFGGMLHF